MSVWEFRRLIEDSIPVGVPAGVMILLMGVLLIPVSLHLLGKFEPSEGKRDTRN